MMYRVFLFGLFLGFFIQASAQSAGTILDFEGNNWQPAWHHSDLSVENSDGVLKISGNNIGGNYQSFAGGIPPVNLAFHPEVYVKIRTEKEVRFELRLLDKNQKETNDGNPVVTILPAEDFKWITLNFRNAFKQSWPDKAIVDSAYISKMSILLNSGGNPNYSGWVEIEEIIFGDSTQARKIIDPVVYQPKINQVGYLLNSVKTAVIPSTKALGFYVVSVADGDTVLRGQTTESKIWDYSEEKVVIADFSALRTPGTYKILAGALKPSYPFVLSDSIYNNVLNQTLKAFYFTRASLDLEEAYAGKYSRKGGHPDNKVKVHPSAASAARPAGFEISAPGGWYDAGDYNKYVVPAGIATWQLLSAWEYYGNVTDKKDLNIPESKNAIPDVVDEAMWEVEWLIKMQDETDGGVYHKLTSANFPPPMKPSDDLSDRYVVQKSTSATLHFAAVLSKAAKVLKMVNPAETDKHTLLVEKAEAAWRWAILHPDVVYDQDLLNQKYDPDINTGDYGVQSYNLSIEDEWLFAATELFLATGNVAYLENINLQNVNAVIPGWADVQLLAVLSIVKNKGLFPEALVSKAETLLLSAADILLAEYEKSAYKVSMGSTSDDFAWNSNGKACNQATILNHAAQLTGNSKYQTASMALIDYVLGKNPLSECFITGSGSKSPMNILHSISATDTVKQPVPGLLANGPHNTYLKDCFYPVSIPAFTYLDDFCSAATNEVAIYVNSAFVNALSGMLSALPSEATGKYKETTQKKVNIFPNPAEGDFTVTIPVEFSAENWEIKDLNGRIMKEGVFETGDEKKIEVTLEPGMYLMQITISNEVVTEKIVVK